MSKTERYLSLDALRGLAVICMFIFHATYDAWLFGIVNIDFKVGFWYAFPRFIVFVFLWCVGASFQITHAQGIKWPGFWKRFFKLAALAFVITAVTYFTFPKTWVYFGTLHCIAAATLLAVPFIYYPWARWPVLIGIVILQYGFDYDIAWAGRFFPHYSMDFIPVYPWFWVTLLGMITGPTVLNKLPRQFPLQKLFVWPGQNALKIYLLHQPALYGVMFLLRRLLDSF